MQTARRCGPLGCSQVQRAEFVKTLQPDQRDRIDRRIRDAGGQLPPALSESRDPHSRFPQRRACESLRQPQFRPVTWQHELVQSMPRLVVEYRILQRHSLWAGPTQTPVLP